MKTAIEKQLIETVQGIDTGLAYLTTGMLKLLDQSDLALKYSIITAREGTPHLIGGFAHGRTSKGDPYVLLYPAQKNLKHKICRVYEQFFHELPFFIETNIIADDAQDGNPDKDAAKNKGIYRKCDWFEIATVPGKETQMGPEQRFLMTIKILNGSTPAPAEQEAPAQTVDQETGEIITPTIEPAPAEAKLNAIIGEGIEELTKPYTYQDGTELVDNLQLQSIFVAYWEQVKEIAANGAALKLWYADNKELVNA